MFAKACVKPYTTRSHFWSFERENFTMDAKRLRDTNSEVIRHLAWLSISYCISGLYQMNVTLFYQIKLKENSLKILFALS